MFFPLFTGMQEYGFLLKLFTCQNRRPGTCDPDNLRQVFHPFQDFLRGHSRSLHLRSVAKRRLPTSHVVFPEAPA